MEDTDAQPAYRTDDDEQRLHIHHPDSTTSGSVEEASWDEFFDRFEEDEMVLVRYADRTQEGDRFELLSRTEAMERATLDDEEVEQALVDGEVVTSEIVDTKVVEQTIREIDTIESEVIDREIVQDEVVDSRLVRREIAGIHLGEEDNRVAVVEDSETLGWDEERTDLEQEIITVEVDETREVTRDIVERMTVESRLVDHEVEGTETLESDTLEGQVDIEGVHRTIIQSDLLGGETITEDIVDEGHFETEFTEDQTILTDLYERRTIEDEVVERNLLTFELVSEEIVSSETLRSTVVESTVLGSDDVNQFVEMERADTAEETATAETTTETTTTETTTTETTSAEMSDETTTETTSAEMTDETATTEATATGSETETTMGDVSTEDTTDETTAMDDEPTTTVVPDDHDVGKDVIDAQGEKIGVITEVDEDIGSVYVDPNPGLAERIRTRLGWEAHDEDAYAVEADRIDEITDDEVRLRSI